MVLITALIGELNRRFHCPVDVLTSGPWSEPLLTGQPGVGDVFSVRSRKTPYWLSPDQRRVVRALRRRGPGFTWLCDGNEAARPMLTRAGITDRFIVDVRDHPLLPGEHATQQWRRLATIDPVAGSVGSGGAPGIVASEAVSGARGGTSSDGAAGTARGARGSASSVGTVRDASDRASLGGAAGMAREALADSGSGDVVAPGGCHLEVSDARQTELALWLRSRGLSDRPLIAIQIGNKRTMRRGLRRLAVNSKYWPNERWATVLRHVRQRHPEHAIVLLGTGPEYRLNAELVELAGVDRLYNVADDLPVPRLVALLARADGLITVDSGPAHVAAAVGCPEVVLFGKASTTLYRPWGTRGADVQVLTGRWDGEPSMLGIDTDAVIAAWDRLRLNAARATYPE